MHRSGESLKLTWQDVNQKMPNTSLFVKMGLTSLLYLAGFESDAWKSYPCVDTLKQVGYKSPEALYLEYNNWLLEQEADIE